MCVKKAIATAVRKFNCFKDKKKKYDIRELIHLGMCIVHFTYFEFNKVKHVLESGAASVACVAGGFYGWLTRKPGTRVKTSSEAAGKWGEGNEKPPARVRWRTDHFYWMRFYKRQSNVLLISHGKVLFIRL